MFGSENLRTPENHATEVLYARDFGFAQLYVFLG